jgi:hypothetical protein
VNTDSTREKLRTLGNNPKPGTPEDFTTVVSEYVDRWTGVIKRLGITL